ncbi:hypothetical protein M5689_014212 [Euphorbia peplus]|nr:hypothetical protein M5689_014212 [Euphorbia peplus]
MLSFVSGSFLNTCPLQRTTQMPHLRCGKIVVRVLVDEAVTSRRGISKKQHYIEKHQGGCEHQFEGSQADKGALFERTSLQQGSFQLESSLL